MGGKIQRAMIDRESSGLSAVSVYTHSPDLSASPPALPNYPTHFLHLLLDMSLPNFLQETSFHVL